MSAKKVYRAIGLMSGTSLDGIDAALIETDGHEHIKPLEFVSVPYAPQERTRIRAVLGRAERDEEVMAVERLLTEAHVAVLEKQGWQADVIGFHGQTIYHNAAEGKTLQLGDGALMADALDVDVVNDLRRADMKAGGQGAPLLPLYHQARIKMAEGQIPVAVLNIGGVANVTYIDEETILAFDTGPGNALMDDFIVKRTGRDFDKGGEMAFQGTINQEVLDEWMSAEYFTRPPPKSLDRDEWNVAAINELSTKDGVATLAGFTVASIRQAHEMLPQAPLGYIVCGGGRHNEYLMHSLSRSLEIPFKPAEALGWNGDAVEAEGFAYFAVRSLLGEPITYPGTTGVAQPTTGGVLHRAKSRAA